MLAGLLGNIGCKLEADERRRRGAIPGRAGISSTAIGAHLSKAGALDRGAELVETTRLFGRGIAAIEPQWIEQVVRPSAQKQLLDPHWEKRRRGGGAGARHAVWHRHLQRSPR